MVVHWASFSLHALNYETPPSYHDFQCTTNHAHLLHKLASVIASTLMDRNVCSCQTVPWTDNIHDGHKPRSNWVPNGFLEVSESAPIKCAWNQPMRTQPKQVSEQSGLSETVQELLMDRLHLIKGWSYIVSVKNPRSSRWVVHSTVHGTNWDRTKTGKMCQPPFLHTVFKQLIHQLVNVEDNTNELPRHQTCFYRYIDFQ